MLRSQTVRSTRRSCPRREIFCGARTVKLSSADNTSATTKAMKDKLITSRDVVNETKKRRARGAERVGDENAQAAHRAER